MGYPHLKTVDLHFLKTALAKKNVAPSFKAFVQEIVASNTQWIFCVLNLNLLYIYNKGSCRLSLFVTLTVPRNAFLLSLVHAFSEIKIIQQI